MRKILKNYKILMIALIFLSSCTTYNTNFPVPPKNAGIQEVVPAQIDNLKPQFRKASEPGGMEAIYGHDFMGIRIIRLPNFESASLTFQSYILPHFKSMPTRFTGNINGKWNASGTDHTGRKWYGWINQNYIFVINAINQEYMNQLIDNFQYISKK